MRGKGVLHIVILLNDDQRQQLDGSPLRRASSDRVADKLPVCKGVCKRASERLSLSTMRFAPETPTRGPSIRGEDTIKIFPMLVPCKMTDSGLFAWVDNILNE